MQYLLLTQRIFHFFFLFSGCFLQVVFFLLGWSATLRKVFRSRASSMWAGAFTVCGECRRAGHLSVPCVKGPIISGPSEASPKKWELVLGSQLFGAGMWRFGCSLVRIQPVLCSVLALHLPHFQCCHSPLPFRGGVLQYKSVPSQWDWWAKSLT